MCEPVWHVPAPEYPRIVFNALALRPGGSGVQTYEREILDALCRVVKADLRAVVQADATGELPTAVTPIVRPTSSGIRRAVSGLRAPGPCDLLHGLDVDVPLRPAAPTVSTVHDLSVFDTPEVFSSGRVVGERLLVSRALRRADAVIAVSGFTADRVRERFGRECVVIGESAPADMGPATHDEVERVRSSYRLPTRFVLHVGNIEPRKNLDLVARACAQAGTPLVLAGMRSPRAASPASATTIGYVPRPMLRGLYGAATIVAFCPVYEGFGLPAIEAMACGVPLVASRIPPLVELTAGCAELVDPTDADGLAGTIKSMLEDPDKLTDMSARGRLRASSFTWAQVAAETAGVYRSLGVAV